MGNYSRIRLDDERSALNINHPMLQDAAWRAIHADPSKTDMLLLAEAYGELRAIYGMTNAGRNEFINSAKRNRP